MPPRRIRLEHRLRNDRQPINQPFTNAKARFITFQGGEIDASADVVQGLAQIGVGGISASAGVVGQEGNSTVTVSAGIQAFVTLTATGQALVSEGISAKASVTASIPVIDTPQAAAGSISAFVSLFPQEPGFAFSQGRITAFVSLSTITPNHAVFRGASITVVGHAAAGDFADTVRITSDVRSRVIDNGGYRVIAQLGPGRWWDAQWTGSYWCWNNWWAHAVL